MAVVLPLAAAQADEDAKAPWPMFRHDLLHTGRTHFTGPAEPEILWTFATKDGIASSPCIAEDGTVYVGSGWDYRGSSDPALYALNSDGTLKWRYQVGGGVFSSPSIGPDGTVYFGSLDNSIYAVEDHGEYATLAWGIRFGHWVYSSPAVLPDGSVFIGGLDFNVYALDRDGAIRWSHLTDWCVFSSPAVTEDGVVYIGSKDEYVYSFTTPGTLLWQSPTGTFYDGHLVDSSPAVGFDGTIYVGTDPYGAVGQTPVPVTNVLFAFNPDGSLKWSFPMDDGAESSPAIGHDGTVYIGSYDGHLYAIEDQDVEGVLKWTFETGGWVDGSPAVDGCGTIYVGSRDSHLYAINPDGTLRWKMKTGDGIESSPAIDDRGILYVGSFDGNLYAVGNPGPDAGVVNAMPSEPDNGDTGFVPTVTVRNYRRYRVDGDVHVKLEHGGDILYEATDSFYDLEGGEEETVVFSRRTDGPVNGDITLTATVILDEDTNPHNDTLVLVIPGDDTGIEKNEVPAVIFLEPPFPNPFNAGTVIRYTIAPDGTDSFGVNTVSLTVHDLRGAVVRVLADDFHLPGTYQVSWDGDDESGEPVASGIYFVRIRAGGFFDAVKITLAK